ncbi:helix-turn-helix domain-containing protein [Desulfosarcina sp. OttesenSCG-928-A07]|nr:helix-turn-helix domain-containing protein [Desulfosarcina sp. OttesenSCG-928-G17]MDL2329871.1 helix-turn-helix domain-containing protein [Desulfosarcina sp. OttesenSCG-928-A07]
MDNTKNHNDQRYVEIGLKIAYYPKRHGYTQEQLAEKIGINPKYLSNIETPSSVQPISLKTLFSIADTFQVPPHKFLEFD